MKGNIKVPFSRPVTGKEELKNIKEVLKSGWLTTGKFAAEFEKQFAAETGSKYALACNSATAGLHLSLESLADKNKPLVITTPYTFTASAEICRYMGCDPLFVDINKNTLNIDPVKLRNSVKKFRKKISAVIPVHIAGLPCKMDEIMDICGEIPVIEDAAHTYPLQYKGKSIGRWGSTGVFSFYANKTITSGEGGMVITDNEEIAERISLMRTHGMSRQAWDRYSTVGAKWKYDIVEPGFKYNMPDLCAAVGLAQLQKAEHFKAFRKKAAEFYTKHLTELDSLILPESSDDHAWHLYIIRLKTEKFTISRDQFIEKLSEMGVGTSVHYIPLHLMTYYKNKYNLKAEQFPESLKAYQSAVSLPMFPDINRRQLEHVINCVTRLSKKYYNHSK